VRLGGRGRLLQECRPIRPLCRSRLCPAILRFAFLIAWTYLARYTYRLAISNVRLLDFKDGMVRFRYKDYAHGNRKQVMTLSALEFVRRLRLEGQAPTSAGEIPACRQACRHSCSPIASFE
jgi:hypothetical protein